MRNEKFIENYKYWSGFNQFFFKGRIMFGPNGLKIFVFIFLAINVCITISYVFSILVNNILFIGY